MVGGLVEVSVEPMQQAVRQLASVGLAAMCDHEAGPYGGVQQVLRGTAKRVYKVMVELRCERRARGRRGR